MRARHLSIALLSLTTACGGSSGSTADGDGGAGSGAGGGGGSDVNAAVPPPPPFASCAGSDATDPPSNPLCLVDPGGGDTDPALAVFSQELVDYMGTPAVHITLVFNPLFVDNTYGSTAVGWSRHNFKDLVGSDHADIVMLDSSGAVVYDMSLDYISQDPDKPCGYGSLGPFGGDGTIRSGDPSGILAYSSSLDQNLNDRGYCDYTTDSPATDDSCTPNPDAPNWDFRVVYELWVAQSAFAPTGFGSAYMSNVHASPSKLGTNTVPVVPGDCCTHDVNTGSCDSGSSPPGTCTTSDMCNDGEFCYNQSCVPIVD